jgi:hypothetical protein
MKIRRYDRSDRDVWNNFVKDTHQGTFLFNRNYMEYHADRFEDHSLMFYGDDGDLVAILPANIRDGNLYSHQGLSYGGLAYTSKSGTALVLSCFSSLIEYGKSQKFKSLIYKRVPSIYHRYMADEDLYAMFLCNAELIRRDIGYVIDLTNRIPISRNKKRYLKNFQTADYEITVSHDFEKFYSILESSLSRHYVKPIHTAEELKALTSGFHDSISLYSMLYKGEAHAFCWLFSTHKVLHVQNMAASEYGRSEHFIDYMYNWILSNLSKNYLYLSFGISTENEGQSLNFGLADQKERFGARGVAHDFYKLSF